MHMETMQCNYSGMSDMLRTGVPLSPPDTPPGDMYLESHGNDCKPSLFAETRYVQPEHLTTIYDDSPYGDANNNTNNGDQSSYYNDSLNSLSNLRIHEEDLRDVSSDDPNYGSSSSQYYNRNNSKDSTCSMASTTSSYGGASPRRKKSSKSSVSSKSSISSSSSSESSTVGTEGGRSRKDSFVYDVRLTNEQFLFLVPDMDLVKSHLMFAVREEVEVLKERIVELMDRINVLEVENSVLRQYASPEALLQVQQQQQQQQQQAQHPTT